MKFSIVFLLSIFFVFFGNSKFKGGTHAIRSGDFIQDISHAYFMVALHVTRGDESYLCGGAIISNSSFVTAAHCLCNSTSASVRLGSLHPFANGVNLNVVHYELHPGWQPGGVNHHFHDIAVGFLQTLLRFNDTINQIEVIEHNNRVAENLAVEAYGYGASTAGPVNELRWTVANVMNFQTCFNNYRERSNRFLDRIEHFCLAPIQGHISHIYDGDSGGPIIDHRTGKLLGIIAGSANGLPDVCIRIAGYRRFLQNPYAYNGRL